MSDVTVDIDLSNAQFGREIPFDAFAELRRTAPVFWYEPEKFWVVTSYHLVREINKDFKRFSNWAGPLAGGGREKDDEPRGANTILTMDPPEHTKFRRMIASSFTTRVVNDLEPMIRPLTRDLLARFAAQGGGDWVSEIATLFPFRVMADLMGISLEDEADVLRRVDIMVYGSTDPNILGSPAFMDAIREADEYADRLVEEHRSHPRNDLIDQLIGAEVDGRPLTQTELRSWVNLYIGAGVETTKHLISNGLVCLLDSPEAREAVRAQRDLNGVVEELLRVTTPVMHHSRWPLESVEIAGQVIEPGQRTTLWMISANHDETIFNDPRRFNISRDPNAHDSFGPTGPHFCIGAGLARLETRVFLEELSPYLDRMELTAEPVRGASNVFNLLKSCPVRVN